MRSVCRADMSSNGANRMGLTIQDYLRRPVTSPAQVSDPSTTCPNPEAAATENTIALRSRTDRGQPSLNLSEGSLSALRIRIEQATASAARKYDLPEKLVRSVIRHESNFDPTAVSPAGAQGLMQLMPGTARELGVKDPFDIRQNIDGGARYLRQMFDQFDGDWRKALAAYNAGPGTVRKYGGVPPYPETRRYVRKVMSSAGKIA